MSDTTEPTTWVAHERLCTCGNPHQRAIRHDATCPVFRAWSNRRNTPLGWAILRLEEATAAGTLTPEQLLEHYRALGADLLTQSQPAPEPGEVHGDTC
jgi:hypothetical protein